MRSVRLRHVAQVNPSTARFDLLPLDADLTFLPMESIWADDRLDRTRTRPKSAVIAGYTRFQDGDVLLPKITPTFEAGRSVLISGLVNGVGAGTTELHVLRPTPQIEPRFLAYVTQSHTFLRLGEAEMYGVAGQKRVPDHFVRDFSITLFDLGEQRRIANFLDRETAALDRMYRLKTQLKGLLGERLSAVRAEALDGLIDRCGEVPLRRFVTSIEQGASPLCDAVPASAGEWGVLKLSSVKRGQFDGGENKRLSEGTPAAKYEVRDGDLLVTRANTPELVGDVAVARNAPSRKLLPDLIYRVGLADRMDPDFVAEVLLGRRVRGLIEASARGSSQSMVKLRGEDIRSWPVPNADRALQRQFVERMRHEGERIRRLDDAIDRQQRLLDERRRALITAAVTGQFDATTARGAGLS